MLFKLIFGVIILVFNSLRYHFCYDDIGLLLLLLPLIVQVNVFKRLAFAHCSLFDSAETFLLTINAYFCHMWLVDKLKNT